MNIRLLDTHADGCPHGGEECEHWDRELLPNETHTFHLDANLHNTEGILHKAHCEVLTVKRDSADNVTITVNGLDYQAKAMKLAAAWHEAEAKSATVPEMRNNQSGTSTILWLAACLILIGVQLWASFTNQPFAVIAVATALLLGLVATRV